MTNDYNDLPKLRTKLSPKGRPVDMNRKLIEELRLINKAIRSLLQIDPGLSRRRAIRETLEALGHHRRRLVRQNRPILLAERKSR